MGHEAGARRQTCTDTASSSTSGDVSKQTVSVSSPCLSDVVTVFSWRRFICCVSHDIFIRVGLQRVGKDQVLSGL